MSGITSCLSLAMLGHESRPPRIFVRLLPSFGEAPNQAEGGMTERLVVGAVGAAPAQPLGGTCGDKGRGGADFVPRPTQSGIEPAQRTTDRISSRSSDHV